MWKLYLDDVRDPKDTFKGVRGKHRAFTWTVARSTEEAKSLVGKLGMPSFLSLDHDFGGEDKAPAFLSWLANEYWDGVQKIPGFLIHSANSVGSENMESFMLSWAKSITLP